MHLPVAAVDPTSARRLLRVKQGQEPVAFTPPWLRRRSAGRNAAQVDEGPRSLPLKEERVEALRQTGTGRARWRGAPAVSTCDRIN